jgi:dihydroxyacid dehydratase/phosphogluconate dehydratase
MSIDIFASDADAIYDVRTRARGPEGSLPLTPEMLRDRPSGDLFGLSQNAGMGWTPSEAARTPFLILSTQGGLRAADGSPVALGYHTGHWEIGLLVDAAARELKRAGVVPFAAYCSDPCDGRTQGTSGMFDSLPYRNDAAIVFRRLIRSLPTRAGVLGIATCDKGLPAMMMALAGAKDLPSVLVPGGVTLPARMRAGSRRSARASRTACCRCRTQPISAVARARRPAAAASSSARLRRRKSSAKRSACRCRTRRSRHRDSRSGPISPCGRRARCCRSPRAASRRRTS